MNLSHVDPDVRFSPSLTLTFALSAVGADDNEYLHDVYIDGAECESGDDLFTIGAPVDNGDGSYTVSISSPVQATGYLQCEWIGHPSSMGRDQVIFRN